MSPRKAMICSNTSWNLVNFRSGLIRALIQQGYEVVALAPTDKHSHLLSTLGCRHIPLEMDNHGTHPLKDARLAAGFFQVLRHERPAVFLGYTIKPNVYGSLAAHLLGIPVINNIAGLGTAFGRSTWLTPVVRTLYRMALHRSARVLFQNPDDRGLFIEHGIVKVQASDLVPGSGVDLERFAPTPSPVRASLRFLLVARMLWDKGIGEYVAAARALKASFPHTEFCLLGFLDGKNPSSVPAAQMKVWVDEGLINYLGATDDVRPHLALADCVVLPSYYREGTPRALLEAAAMGRPIITTTTAGCREVVSDGVTGYLCPPRNVPALVSSMDMMLKLDPHQRALMGQEARRRMEQQFDEQIVIKKYQSILKELDIRP